MRVTASVVRVLASCGIGAASAMAIVILAAVPLGPVLADEAAGGESFVFYPAPPAEPRLQFLAGFNQPSDVAGGGGGLRSFIFGGNERERDLIEKPYGLAIFEGAIYVVDARGGGYGVFDLAQNKTRFVEGVGAGSMSKPINITIDTDGTRYITDTGRKAVLIYDREDRFSRAFGLKDQGVPVDVAIAGERLYVTDVDNMQVHVIDKSTGRELDRFGEPGSEAGKLFHPTNIAVAPDGSLYVTDTTNFRVQQFTAEGEFIREIGSIGVNAGHFVRPKGVALDREGRIYVVDAAFENVQVLARDGAALTAFGGVGDGPGNLNLPTAVTIDDDNVRYFRRYAAPGFELHYIVAVASQYGHNKVSVYGFGSMTEAGGIEGGAVPSARDR